MTNALQAMFPTTTTATTTTTTTTTSTSTSTITTTTATAIATTTATTTATATTATATATTLFLLHSVFFFSVGFRKDGRHFFRCDSEFVRPSRPWCFAVGSCFCYFGKQQGFGKQQQQQQQQQLVYSICYIYLIYTTFCLPLFIALRLLLLFSRFQKGRKALFRCDSGPQIPGYWHSPPPTLRGRGSSLPLDL